MNSLLRKSIPVLFFLSLATAGYAESADKLIDQLQAALKEEAQVKTDKSTEKQTPPERMGFDSSASALAASLHEWANRGDGAEFNNVLAQISGGSASEKVKELCRAIAGQLSKEREIKEKAYVEQVDAALKRVGEAVIKAKKEKELDPILLELSGLRDQRNFSSGASARRASEKIYSAVQFVNRWQDYLAQLNGGNETAAKNTLRNLANNNGYPIIPRSEILAKMGGDEGADFPKKKTSAGADKILSGIKTLDDIGPKLDEMKNSGGPIDSQIKTGLTHIQQRYAEFKSGIAINLNVPIIKYDNQGVFASLKSQLVLLMLPQYLHAPDKKPQAGETVSDYIARIISEAKQKNDWTLVLNAFQASANINLGSFYVLNDTTKAISSFLAGQNQEKIGQFTLAVISYQNASHCPAENIPLQLIGERLKAIQRDHPQEYEKAIRTSDTTRSVVTRSPGQPGIPSDSSEQNSEPVATPASSAK